MGLIELWVAQGKAIKTLFARYSNTYKTFEQAGVGAYQVPSGKKLKVGKVLVWSATANQFPVLGYGDSAVDGTTAPTNAVYFGWNGSYGSVFTCATAYVVYVFEVYFEIPGGKYPFVSFAQGGSHVMIMGVEE